MARTFSTMVALDTRAPGFSLPNVVNDEQLNPFDQKFKFKAHVILFICNHCPFVKHINSGLIKLARDYLEKEVQFIAISSNDSNQYPEDGPDKMREVALTLPYPFPYLYDEDQSVAKAFGAVCTPDFFVYDANLLLKYRGQFDDSRPGNEIPVTGDSLAQALDAILADKADKKVPEPQMPSVGCSIKWK